MSLHDLIILQNKCEELEKELEYERERSKILVEAFDCLIDTTAEDCRGDEVCGHCEAVRVLKEYREVRNERSR